MIVVLMGVSGVGKTTIGKLLSARTGWNFEDADDYHSGGKPAENGSWNPTHRFRPGPWLNALHERMLQYRQKGRERHSGLLSAEAAVSRVAVPAASRRTKCFLSICTRPPL